MVSYKVYVIDDDKFIAEALKDSFELHDTAFNIQVFTDPSEGLRATISSPPDLVFLDLMMPYIRGEEILTQLRKKNVPTRVVVVTVITDVAKVVELIKAGACDYITKPFSPQEIIKAAKRVVVLEETLDKAEPDNYRRPGRDLKREMLYSLYLNLVEYFNLDELEGLCFQLGFDDESLQGHTKESKAKEIVQYCKRQGLIKKLAETCVMQRPKVAAFSHIASSFFY